MKHKISQSNMNSFSSILYWTSIRYAHIIDGRLYTEPLFFLIFYSYSTEFFLHLCLTLSYFLKLRCSIKSHDEIQWGIIYFLSSSIKIVVWVDSCRAYVLLIMGGHAVTLWHRLGLALLSRQLLRRFRYACRLNTELQALFPARVKIYVHFGVFV